MIRLIDHPDRPPCLRSDLLADRGVPHAFSTRRGGVSDAPFDSLNLGNPSEPDLPHDTVANLAENFRRLRLAIGCEERTLVQVHQIHGRECVYASAGVNHTEGDALYSDDPAMLLSVRVADCVPILLAAADGRAVAAIHAGWRGLVAGVIENTITCFGTPANDLVAAIGPAISAEHFEVGEEVAAAFDLTHVVRRSGHKPHVNLPGAAAARLIAAGLPTSHVDRGNWCTWRDRDLFFSHRRDHGRTGRMAAVIAAAT